MITGKLKLFSEDDLDRLHAAVLRILEETGIQVRDDEFLDALAKTPARVDKARRMVRFPAREVEAFLEERRQRRPEPHVRPREGGYEPAVGCVIAPFLHDFERRTRRQPTHNDLVDIIRWADADTPAQCRVGQAVTMADVDPRLEPIEAYALLLEHTGRPNEAAYASEAAQIPFLLEISEIYHGRRFFPHGPNFMTSPLTFGDRVARHVLALMHFGCAEFGIGVMPISGGNAPMTIAGNVVLSAAELIGAWLAIRALQPEASFNGGVCNGIIDMRRGTALFNAPEALLADLGVVELFERRYGGGVGVAAGADYIDARVPGWQAAHERTYRAMAIAAFAGGAFHMGGTGTLEGGKIFSPVQFILERDMGEGLWRLGQGIRVNEDTLAVDAIAEVGVDAGRSYFDTEHTLRHWNDTWFPKFQHRGAWEGDRVEFGREEAMLEAAHQHYKDAIARYVPPQVDPEKTNAIGAVVQRARHHLADE